MTAQSSAGTPAVTEAVESEADPQGAEASASGTPSSNEDASKAQSSGAVDATEATLEQVIRNAVKPVEAKAEDPAPSSREGQTAESADAETQPEATGEAKPPNDADVPFHKHPRWQELKRERDTYKSGHEQFEQVQSFIRTNNLSNEEVAAGFQIMALMRQDPEKALEALRPYVSSLEQVTGRALPEDLQSRVENGLVDEDTARETARLRHERLRFEAIERDRVARESQRAHVDHYASIQSAVTTTERDIQSSDPDYARKQPFILDRVRALIAEKQPQSVEESVAIVRQAHNEITKQLSPMVQRKPVTQPRSGDSSSSSRPVANSLLDVVRNAVKS